MDLKNLVDKKYADKSPAEILKLPISAIKGVSDGDAELMKKAFSVKTVADLASLKYAVWANEISAKSGDKGLDKSFIKKLDKKYESKSPLEILKSPVDALQGISADDAKSLKTAFNIKTVKDLADFKFVKWAKDIVELSTQKPAAKAEPVKTKAVKKTATTKPATAVKTPAKKIDIKEKPVKSEKPAAVKKTKAVDDKNNDNDKEEKKSNLVYIIAVIAAIALIAIIMIAIYLKKQPPVEDQPVTAADVPAEIQDSQTETGDQKTTVIDNTGFSKEKTNQKTNLEAPEKTVKTNPEQQNQETKSAENQPTVKKVETVAPGEKAVIVKEGDTLFSISKEKTGSAENWKKLHELNKETVSDPAKIYPGQKIILP